MKLHAGRVEDIHEQSGQWAFVDIGFSRIGKTGGLLVHDGEPDALTFNDLRNALVSLGRQRSGPLNLVLEAPLSAAFTAAGNPTGRSIEKSESGHRYWYAGLGCQVTLAAAYLLRAMLEAGLARDVRLFEAFVTFKTKETRTSHTADVLAMRDVAWGRPEARGQVLVPTELAGPHASEVRSAFAVFGFDCQVPPVIVARVVTPSPVL